MVEVTNGSAVVCHPRHRPHRDAQGRRAGTHGHQRQHRRRAGHRGLVPRDRPELGHRGAMFSVSVTPKDQYGNTTTIGVSYSNVTATNGMGVNGAGGTFADPAETLTNTAVGLQTSAKTVTMTFDAGSVHGTSNTITVNPDWFSENISDPWIQEGARAGYKANGSLNYGVWLQSFNTVVQHYSSMPSWVITSLQVLLNNAAFLNSPASDTDLASKVIDGDPDNAIYNSLNSGVVVTTALGNLGINSPSSQLQELVNKWFLGVNYPTSTYGTGSGGSAPNATPSYSLVSNVPLFAAGESSSGRSITGPFNRAASAIAGSSPAWRK